IFDKSIFLTRNQRILTVLPSQFTGRPEPVLPDSVNLAADIAVDNNIVPAKSESKLYTIGSAVNSGKSTATIAGNIRNAETGEPMPGVYSSVAKPKIVMVTDGCGFCSLTLPKGKYDLTIRAVGAKETQRKILLHDDGELDINLVEEPVTL